jgi:arginyl-tRNA synthetase
LIGDELVQLIQKAIKKAQRKGDLPRFEVPPVPIEHPNQADWGDYATPVCMQLAPLARMAPVQIAEIVVKRLAKADYLDKVEVAHPGFINFTLADAWLAQQVEAILATGETYGDVDLGQGKKVQVEYVSANPTGPLTVGSARNAVLGDGLASVLAAAGYEVQREYYVNDAGSQMRFFNETVYIRYAQALGQDEPMIEKGYQGNYMIEMGQQLAQEHSDEFLRMDREEAIEALGEIGLKKILEGISSDLELMGVHHDNWFSERSLYEDGYFAKIMTLLRQRDHLAEREGAVWFKAEELGGGKDEVVVRSTGEPGYFASDIAYHYNKFIERGFDWVIDVWGADHQGHVPRMKAMMRALGLDPERLTLIIYQLVTLTRGGEIVRLSKRTGDIITMREVLEEVGPDAVRFFLLARAADSQMDFDLDLAKEQSERNPVYYVQYSHARIASILRYAQEQGVTSTNGDIALLTHPSELALIRQMLNLPEIVALAAQHLAPHHLTYYAQDLAAAFHVFYRDCRVVSSDPADAELTQARLKLAQASKIVLANTLRLMGVSAPERM